eukprot:gene2881-17100_t
MGYQRQGAESEHRPEHDWARFRGETEVTSPGGNVLRRGPGYCVSERSTSRAFRQQGSLKNQAGGLPLSSKIL